MTVQEAARLLEIKPSTVYSLCASGQLGHERIGVGRGVIRIGEADIEAFRQSARAKGLAMVKKPPRPETPLNKDGDPFGGHVFKHIRRPV